ncbi:hypothetical protein FQK02_00870 [Xanthomonas vasicola]|uniref:Uncharacterized protein n=1 Tax=Xanthomonas vasicola pv. vasculorum NCPPB 890 TaxID=1184265 RepID=A0A837B5Y2_XANVA|nr:hypothetical protein KW5_0107950 [Xanthomonas vasicola pv. vasculorum NCPPB 1326]KFA31290.1 hypothetical protein KWG_0110965 [Xanthomonas vasicola pv. vasculorum NCPPB 1381]TWQ07608.1 hypothetical protein FQK02_00870 [Xanthomonas vasicola]
MVPIWAVIESTKNAAAVIVAAFFFIGTAVFVEARLYAQCREHIETFAWMQYKRTQKLRSCIQSVDCVDSFTVHR